MLLTKRDKTTYKTITFRLDEKLIKEFRKLCKAHDYKQVSIIENAMKKAIEELKGLDSEK